MKKKLKKHRNNKPINKYRYLKRNINPSEIIEKRYKILTILIIIIMLMLLVRLFYIQVIRNSHYVSLLDVLTANIIEGESTPRGKIYDRNGNLIVTNISLKTIYYKKDSNVTIKDEIKLAYKVASYIDVNYSKVTEDMLRDFWVKSNSDKAKKRIKKSEWKKYEERKLNSNDIEKLKLERVKQEELDEFNDLDKEACYIYNLMNKGYSYSEKIIKNEGVTDKEYALIAEHISELGGFNVKMDWERYYPYGDVFKSILGSVSKSTSGIPYELKEYYLEKGYKLSDRVGTSYIEYQYEDYLKGEKATYEILDDGSYKVIKQGSRGNDIVLTIDINLQKQVEEIITEELLLAKQNYYSTYFDKSYVVITDPNTGEVLAMSGKQIIKDDFGNYKVVDYTPGVITSSVTPGSIVKGASHIVGYNTGALSIGEYRNDACIKIAATPIKCSYRTYGYINDIQALKYSSNTYQFQTAIKVGGGHYKYNAPLVIDKNAFNIYRDTFKEFGLGTLTEIDLPNEALGYRGKNTLSGLLLDFSIGQYDTYTPIEIAQYISTIANDGVRLKPHLLKAVYSSSGDNLTNLVYQAEKEELNKVKTEEKYLNRVKDGFREVMTGGTGYYYVDSAYNAAGKTGTAESFIDTDGDGVVDMETVTANFVGYAPYDNPEVTFTVISPDIGPNDVNYNILTNVNQRITQKVTQKYFEIYQ